MDKNYLLLLVVVLAALVVVIVVVMDYLKRNCNQIVQVYPSCPNIPSSQYTDTPTGRCLLSCDQYSDNCYGQCNPKDQECIRRCYQIKAQCYMDCLEAQRSSTSQENFVSKDTCGCGV